MRVAQDKPHHRSSSEHKSPPRSIVATTLDAAPELELTTTQKEEVKQARLSESPQKTVYPQPVPTREKTHKQATRPVIVQPTQGV